jgi:hypothetical protein
MSRRQRRYERSRQEGPHRIAVAPLGTTWYDRGFAYWLRRVWFVLMLVIALAVIGAMVYGLVSAAAETSPGAAIAVVTVIGGCALASGIWLWLRSTPAAIEARALQTDKASPGQLRAAGRLGGLLGAGGLAGVTAATAILVIGGSLVIGPVVVLLLRSLGQQLPQERAERVKLAMPPLARWTLHGLPRPGASGQRGDRNPAKLR